MGALGLSALTVLGPQVSAAPSSIQPENERLAQSSERRGHRERGKRGNREERRARRADRLQQLVEKLGLTETQKAKVQSIMQNGAQQAKAVRNNASLSQEEKRERLRSVRRDTREQMRGVLTPEQQQKLKAMRKEARADRRERAGR